MSHGPWFDQMVIEEAADADYRDAVREEREETAREARYAAAMVMVGYIKHSLNEGMITCDRNVERDLRGLLRRAGAE